MGFSRVRGRTTRVVTLALVVGVLAVVAIGCGEQEERSFCTVYDEWLDVKREISTLDPTEETAQEAEDVATEALDVTRRLREVEQDRYGDQLETLEDQLQDVVRTLASVPDDADYATWEPLVEESVEDAVDSAQRVQDLIDPTCRPDS
jgi:hypothetical protein